jgi:hypothetical protein
MQVQRGIIQNVDPAWHTGFRRHHVNRNVYGISFIAIWIIAVAMGVSGGPSTGMAADNQPRIEFDSLEHDFGDQVSGKLLEHTFTFKNTGSSLLSIKDVKAG